MARQYDVVSRSRDYTELSVIVGYRNKAGNAAIKRVAARVPFFVEKDNARDYKLAATYLSAGILENVKGIDTVKRYITVNYTMPFSEFTQHAKQTEKLNEKHKI